MALLTALDPLDWSVDDVVHALFDRQDQQRPILGRAIPNAQRIEEHLRHEQIDGDCLLTYVDANILRSEFDLPHGLINKVLQAVTRLRLRSPRYQSEHAGNSLTGTTIPLASPNLQTLDHVHAWRAGTTGFRSGAPQATFPSPNPSNVVVHSPPKPGLVEDVGYTQPRKRLREDQSDTPEPGKKRRRLRLDLSNAVNGSIKPNPAFTGTISPRSPSYETAASSISDSPVSWPISPSLSRTELFAPQNPKKSKAADIFFGFKRLPVDRIFYGDRNIGEEISDDHEDELRWASEPRISKKPDFTRLDGPKIPAGQRIYVQLLMRHYLNSAWETERRGGHIFKVKKPYKASLLPANMVQSVTVGSVYAQQNHKSRKGKERAKDPENSRAKVVRQLVQKPSGGSTEASAAISSQLADATAGNEVSEPSCWDYLAKKYPPVETDVLPIYGDSGSENEFDDETMLEIESERREKAAESELEKFDVEAVIKEGMQDLQDQWYETKLPKRKLQAWAVWNKAHREQNARHQIISARKRIDHIQNERIPTLFKEIGGESWLSKKQVLTQVGVMEQSIFEVEDLKWRISIWKRDSAPHKLHQPAKLIRPKVVQNDEEDIGSTDEDFDTEDMQNFIEDDGVLPSVDTMPEVSQPMDDMDIATHVDDESDQALAQNQAQALPIPDSDLYDASIALENLQDASRSNVEAVVSLTPGDVSVDAEVTESDESEYEEVLEIDRDDPNDEDYVDSQENTDKGSAKHTDYVDSQESFVGPMPVNNANDMHYSDEDELRNASRTPEGLVDLNTILHDEEAETDIEDVGSSSKGGEDLDLNDTQSTNKENIPIQFNEEQMILDKEILNTNEYPTNTLLESESAETANVTIPLDSQGNETSPVRSATNADDFMALADDELENDVPAQEGLSQTVNRNGNDNGLSAVGGRTTDYKTPSPSKQLRTTFTPKSSQSIVKTPRTSSSLAKTPKEKGKAVVIDLTNSDDPGKSKAPMRSWFEEGSVSPVAVPSPRKTKRKVGLDDEYLLLSEDDNMNYRMIEVIDPNIVKSRPASFYQIRDDRRRFLMRLMEDFSDEDKETLSTIVSEWSRRDLRTGVMKCLRELRTTIASSEPTETEVEKGLVLTTKCYITYVLIKEYDGKETSSDLKRVLKTKKDFYVFRRWFREILSHYGYAFIDLLPNHDSDEEKKLRENVAFKREKEEVLDETTMDFEDPNEPAPSSARRKRVRSVKQDAKAREQRNLDQKRVQEQQERRKLLHQNLNKVDSDGKQQIIVNDADIEDENSANIVYFNERFTANIQPHQIEGVRFLWRELITDKKSGCLLAHTMGLGKTMQVIALLVTIAEALSSGVGPVSEQIPASLRPIRALVLCPPGLILNWWDEFLLWGGDAIDTILGPLRKITADLKMPERLQEIESWAQAKEGGILLMGYETFRDLITQPKSDKRSANLTETQRETVSEQLLTKANIVIADEAHKLKNRDSVLAKCAAQFSTTSRIALTGSPLNNNLEEYYAMINWVSPNYLGSVIEFKAKYSEPIHDGLWSDSTGPQRRSALIRLKVLKDQLRPKMDRADMSVLPAGVMPPKTEFFITLRLTDLQRAAYTEIVRRLKDGRDLSGVQTARIWAWLGIFKLLCLHPAILEGSLRETKGNIAVETELSGIVSGDGDGEDEGDEDGREDNADIDMKQAVLSLIREWPQQFEEIVHSNKMLFLYQIVNCACKANEKVLVFSGRLKTLTYVEDFLKVKSIKYARLDGGSKMSDRQSAAKSFNTGDIDVYLISTKAGGLGLNLQGATRVVIMDYDWNPMWEQQAVGRAYRIGQSKPVFVYRFKLAGTYEDIMHNMAVFKTQLSHTVIDNKNLKSWAKKNVKHYLKEPVDPDRNEEFLTLKGKDPLILDRILSTAHCESQILNIELSETFQADDDEELTPDEIKLAAVMHHEEHLKRTDPAAYDKLMAEKQAQVYAENQAKFAAIAEANARAQAQERARFMAMITALAKTEAQARESAMALALAQAKTSTERETDSQPVSAAPSSVAAMAAVSSSDGTTQAVQAGIKLRPRSAGVSPLKQAAILASNSVQAATDTAQNPLQSQTMTPLLDQATSAPVTPAMSSVPYPAHLMNPQQNPKNVTAMWNASAQGRQLFDSHLPPQQGSIHGVRSAPPNSLPGSSQGHPYMQGINTRGVHGLFPAQTLAISRPPQDQPFSAPVAPSTLPQSQPSGQVMMNPVPAFQNQMQYSQPFQAMQNPLNLQSSQASAFRNQSPSGARVSTAVDNSTQSTSSKSSTERVDENPADTNRSIGGG